eukprot:TRINITY_DN161513_c0_g1_i1.p1 TRINITY_DN161513_c0_g1~~TRINITY_DN161513_c0_g1_i1.p1  ORF type:complete len:340 (-),score=94.56 TRINITY_DN161513_c0_g1_i1:142-1161(-)
MEESRLDELFNNYLVNEKDKEINDLKDEIIKLAKWKHKAEKTMTKLSTRSTKRANDAFDFHSQAIKMKREVERKEELMKRTIRRAAESTAIENINAELRKKIDVQKQKLRRLKNQVSFAKSSRKRINLDFELWRRSTSLHLESLVDLLHQCGFTDVFAPDFNQMHLEEEIDNITRVQFAKQTKQTEKQLQEYQNFITNSTSRLFTLLHQKDLKILSLKEKNDVLQQHLSLLQKELNETKGDLAETQNENQKSKSVLSEEEKRVNQLKLNNVQLKKVVEDHQTCHVQSCEKISEDLDSLFRAVYHTLGYRPTAVKSMIESLQDRLIEMKESAPMTLAVSR